MDGTAVRGESRQVAEEAKLARAAAGGDGGAFAELYRRYAECVYNLAYRIVGSDADAADAVRQAFLDVARRAPGWSDGEADFGFELLAATRRICDGLVGGRQDPRQVEGGPRSRQGELRDASLRLPERQREALALRGLARLSYEEIAAIMEMSDGAVAQLICRARINFYDELRGTVLASVAPPSPECERALPLIAAREDGQLQASSSDAAWLDAHLAGCNRCELAVEQMQEAAASYAAWAPIAAPPWLPGEAMAKATPPASGPPAPRNRKWRRPATLMTVSLALLCLIALAAAVLLGDGGSPTPAEPASGTAAKQGEAAPQAGAKTGKAGRGSGDAPQKRGKGAAAQAPTGAAQAEAGTPAPAAIPAQVTTEGGGSSEPSTGSNSSPGKTAVQPTHQTAASKPSSKPKPAPAPQPAAESAPPPTESPPPAEEAPEKPGRSGEAPGKPPDRPPR